MPLESHYCEIVTTVARKLGLHIEFETNIDHVPQHIFGSLDVWKRRGKLRNEQ